MASDPTGLIGRSKAFDALRDTLVLVARSPTDVLLVGESGTGKGAAARALHGASPRAAGPFVVVDVGGLAPTLVESTLFGHEKGAFTDAHAAREGLFRRASGGTLVLDDVDVLPLEVQVKLLRVLQEREVEPLGAESSVAVDVRVVATTRVDLQAASRSGRFRLDLYYRLAVLPLSLPPLRVREGDVELLAAHFAGAGASVPKKHGAGWGFSPGALARLLAHSWPGNVRELEHAVQRALALAGPVPDGDGPALLPEEAFDFLEEAVAGAADDLARETLARGLSLAELEQAVVTRAVEEERGNKSAAARRVGISRRALEHRLRPAPRALDGDPS